MLTFENSGLVKAVEAGLVAAAAVGSYQLLKQLVTRQAKVEVWPDQVVVHYHGRPQPLSIPFADVEYYKCTSLRDREELVFRLRNSATLKISANRLFGPIGDFAGVVCALEYAAESYQQRNPSAMIRACSFFERPAATVLLGVATALLLLVIGKVISDDRTSIGSLLGAVGAYLTYLGTWWSATNRRSQQPE